jgi:small subunit ribosomal protein S8
MSKITDPIADMLTRIRNALIAKHTDTVMPYSKMKEEIAKILAEEGYIERYEVEGEVPHKNLTIVLKYAGNRRREVRPVITGLERVSKPGRRLYTGTDEIPWVLSGMGIAILTTPQGLMTGQNARRERLGGEILCYVW